MRGKVFGLLPTGLSVSGSLLFCLLLYFIWHPSDHIGAWIVWMGIFFLLLFLGSFIGMQLGMVFSKKYEVNRPQKWLLSALISACLMFAVGAGGQALFSISFEKEETYKGTDVVLLLDASGSMDYSGYSEPRTDAGTQFVDGLNETCQLEAVSFAATVLDHTDPLILDSQNKYTIKQFIAGIDSIGGTNFENPLKHAITMLDYYGRKDCGKAVILLTDGYTESSDNVSEATKNEYYDRDIKVFTIRIDSNTYMEPETQKLVEFAEKTGGYDVQLQPDSNGNVSAEDMLEAFQNAFTASSEEDYAAFENLLIYSNETTAWQWFVRIVTFVLGSMVAGYGYFGKIKRAGLVMDGIIGLLLAIFISAVEIDFPMIGCVIVVCIGMASYVMYCTTGGDEIDV